jgi:hypothetical protein
LANGCTLISSVLIFCINIILRSYLIFRFTNPFGWPLSTLRHHPCPTPGGVRRPGGPRARQALLPRTHPLRHQARGMDGYEVAPHSSGLSRRGSSEESGEMNQFDTPRFTPPDCCRNTKRANDLTSFPRAAWECSAFGGLLRPRASADHAERGRRRSWCISPENPKNHSLGPWEREVVSGEECQDFHVIFRGARQYCKTS